MFSGIDLKNFGSAIAQVAEEKGIPKEKILETIEMAIAAAYKKEYGKKGQVIKAKLNPGTGELKFWQVKTVVEKSMLYTEEELAALKEGAAEGEPRQGREIRSEDYGRERLKGKGKEEESSEAAKNKEKVRFNPEKHIMIEEAKKIKAKIKAGEELETPLEPKAGYGRIAAQTAKQVITQRIRESERESIFEEYKGKEGEIISGIVQRIEGKNVFMDIGKTLGILPREEQVPGEFYRPGQRLKTLVLKVEQTPKGPVIFLSRAYPKLVSKLFELEVPELSAGQVQIKSIAREAGSRTKIAVASTMEGIDPIGASVGQRGTRVTAVINELGGEKIDIIEYSEEPEKYIANSLSPAKINEVKRLPKNKALVIVPEDQLSLAIGKDGQNVRLAAKLTGWKIDVRSSERAEEGKEENPPAGGEKKKRAARPKKSNKKDKK